ncbi:unnamed protein product [Lupinus luteus]|uniref:CCHC-type domain-containing protein n=1 Tax=Lupinus luteus TaxID=3873 RepID=A0AAV1XL13_LUPLU
MEGGEQLNEGGYGGEVEKIISQECISGSLDKEEKMVVDEKLCKMQTENCVLQVEDEKGEITAGNDVDVGFGVAETVVVSEEVEGVSSVVHDENKGPNGSVVVNGRSVSGAKRARVTVDEHQPSVHFIYNFLTRASKQKLEELLQQWSEWHGKHVSSSNDPKEVLESGEETFFPALKVGDEKTSPVPFWMDNQTINDENKGFVPLNHNSVPLYDRGYALGLTSADGPSNLDGGLEIIDEAARCFNCGSYSHSLRECTKPRDNVAVNNARNQLKSRRNQNGSSRNPTRYYQNSPTGKYAGLRPGALDDVTRKLLGLGELDPPPWLKRMREIGYPPGYVDVDDDDQPSGITIYADKEIAEQEDGQIKGIKKLKPKRKMTVEFPGINAPIPENADERLWSAGAAPSSYDISNISRNLPQHRSNHTTDYGSRGHFREPRLPGDFRDDAPPGDQGFSSPRYSFHPMYDRHDSLPISSSMSRFQPEWSRRSPVHDEEPRHPRSFHSLYYSSSSERLLFPLDQDLARFGNWSPGSLYDRDRDRAFQNRYMSDDWHYRSWR